MRVLVIEDDRLTASFVVRGLSEAGFGVEAATDGREGLRLALQEPFACAVVDVMLPGLGGLELVAELRRRRVATPVIFLSARGEVEDRVRGLETGGDDYLAKPFSLAELVARVQALVRRTTQQAEPARLTVGDLTVDVLRRRVSRGTVEIDLQPREYALLEYLVRHAGRVVTRTMIMENVWEYHFDPQTNVVEARVCRLRDKIDRPFERKLIRTVRGAGYVLEDGP